MHKHNFHTLKNGMRVITAPMTDTAAVSIMFMVNVGSRYEDKELSGVSHFLEHLAFKGTKKRPDTLTISTDLDALGADFNAVTSEEFTAYYIKLQAKDFETGLEILYDMLYDSLYEEKEIDREKGVISAELNMYKDDPKRYVYQLAQNLVYGDTPLGRDVGGTHETVRNLNREKFIDFRNKFYGGQNMVIAVAGKQEGDWFNEIAKLLETKSTSDLNKFEINKDTQSKPQLILEHRAIDQTNFILAFRTFSRFDKRRYAAIVLDNILGGTMSSRLFISVRERKGLAYAVRSFADFYGDTGDLGIYAGVDTKRAELAIKTVREEIEKMKNELVNEKELSKAKENICGKMFLSLEDSMEIAQYFASQELFYNGIEIPQEFCGKIQKVTAEEVKDLAREVFDFNKSNLAIIGPFKDKEKFLKLIQ